MHARGVMLISRWNDLFLPIPDYKPALSTCGSVFVDLEPYRVNTQEILR